jgi:hypothetical protein
VTATVDADVSLQRHRLAAGVNHLRHPVTERIHLHPPSVVDVKILEHRLLHDVGSIHRPLPEEVIDFLLALLLVDDGALLPHHLILLAAPEVDVTQTYLLFVAGGLLLLLPGALEM